jgi:hypothetical protein
MDTAMNNEPVAWMKEVEGGTMYTNYEYPGSIPLYTHPAKTLTETEDTECQYCKQGCIRCDARKLLTDEEILREAYYILMREQQRKAQEK